MNFSHTELNKISKYLLRLKKSISNKNINKFKEYYDHLKYHIQLGGLGNETNKDVNDVLTNLDNVIKQLDSTSNFESVSELNKKLDQYNNDKKSLNELNNELKQKNDELNQKLSESVNNIDTVTKIDLDKKIKSKDDKIKSLNNQITTLNEKLTELTTQEEKIKTEEINKDKEIETLKSMLEQIFNETKITQDTLDKKVNEVISKISKYNKIINEIKKNNIDDIDSNEDDKFNNALNVFSLKLEESTNLQTKLTQATEQIEKLTSQLKNIETITTELSKTKSELDELKTTVKNKDDEIDQLKKTINKMTEEKKQNEEKIKDFEKNFNTKIRELLGKFYGETLVDSILSGNAFGVNNEKK